MLTSPINRYFQRSLRHIHSTIPSLWQSYENERHYEPGEDALSRTWHGLTYDFRRWKRRYQEARKDAFRRRNPIAHMKQAVQDAELFPFRAEILIIGGGLSGSSTAYWLKERFRDEDFKVVVVENNDKFTQNNAPPDINLLPNGFLYLARNEEETDSLRKNWKLQVDKGACVALLSKSDLQDRFPFMNFDDVVLGSLGKGEGLLAVPVPVRPRRRTNFIIHAPDVPVDMPSLVEPCGVYCRQLDIGNNFVVGRNPSKVRLEEDNDERESLEVDYNEFYENVWPVLVRRVSGFQSAKIKSAWCGLQDVNTFDSAPVIGEHPLYQNLFMMCGFGGRGAMHSLAAGRAFAERLFEGAYVNVYKDEE
ncbi:unnamed protein product [Strongylus vulgaris]|uniref:FAD-dependent oxidoreductase domain-containing protein 1 n=1 Tax=Strongylus vulgaris TaxID=40348 RepID=A0A3P7LEW3_STRVU|nr:unnamed protein product [Strongylus vulgaris]